MSELNYKELQEKGVFDVPYKAFQFMQHQQSEIDQLKVQLSLQRDRNKALEAELTSSRNYGDQLEAEKAGLLRLAEQWREQAKELCRVDDKYVIGSLLSCAERLEEAVRGEHE